MKRQRKRFLGNPGNSMNEKSREEKVMVGRPGTRREMVYQRTQGSREKGTAS